MKEKEQEWQKRLTETYLRDTNAMILVFAQWCVNHGLDPFAVYKEAYPEQGVPVELQNMTALTVSKEEAGEISLTMLINVLLAFDNERLATIVQEKAETFKK